MFENQACYILIESMQRCMYSMTQKPDIYCCILSIYNKLDFYDDI